MAIALYSRRMGVMKWELFCTGGLWQLCDGYCFVQQAYGSDDVMGIALYSRLMGVM